MSRRPIERFDAPVIFAAAFIVRAVFCFAVYPSVADQFGPGDGYDQIALNLVSGHGYTIDGALAAAERLPLYPLFLSVSYLVFGPAAWPWQLAQCACGAWTCVLVLTTARQYASRTGALIAAAVCAVHPTLVLYTARPLTETLYVLLLVLFVRAVCDPQRAGTAGALLGLQWLIKTTALLGVPAFIPVCWRRLATVGRATTAVALVLFPWVAWNLITTGQPHLFTATGGRALYHGLYISQHVSWTTPVGDFNRDAELALRHDLAARGIGDDAPVTVRDRLAGQLARHAIATHPSAVVQLFARNVLLTWYLGRSRLSMLVHGLLHGALLLAAAIGAYRLWRSSPHTHELVAVAVLLTAAYTLFHAAVQPAVRYILPVVPLVAILAAGAMRRLQEE